MAEVIEKTAFQRLEDFILVSKEGKKVQADIELRKVTVKQKVHPETTEDTSTEIDAYMLIGDYVFRVGEDVYKVSKPYLLGFLGEPLDTIKLEKNIANERLKLDYGRLREAKIEIEEKYF